MRVKVRRGNAGACGRVPLGAVLNSEAPYRLEKLLVDGEAYNSVRGSTQEANPLCFFKCPCAS